MFYEEPSSPFLFTIYISKIVIQYDTSLIHVKKFKRNTAGNDRNTLSKLHRDLSLLAKVSRWSLYVLRWLPMVLFSYNRIYRDQTLSARITRGMFVASYNLKIFHIQSIGGPIQCVVSYRDQYAHFIHYII